MLKALSLQFVTFFQALSPQLSSLVGSSRTELHPSFETAVEWMPGSPEPLGGRDGQYRVGLKLSELIEYLWCNEGRPKMVEKSQKVLRVTQNLSARVDCHTMIHILSLK